MDHRELRALHGRVIDRLTIEWAPGVLRVELRGGGAVAALGFTAVRCPRHRRWSESAEIYDARLSAGALRLELHSGDVLEVAAERFAMLRPPGFA